MTKLYVLQQLDVFSHLNFILTVFAVHQFSVFVTINLMKSTTISLSIY